MQTQLTKKQLKKQSIFNFFKKSHDEDYREIGFWICTLSAALSLSLMALLAGVSLSSIVTTILNFYGLMFGLKGILLVRWATPYNHHFHYSLKWLGLCGAFLVGAKLI